MNRNEQSLRDIIACTMELHPKACMFRPDAAEYIFQRVMRATRLHGWGKETVLDACEEAFHEAEIYCPLHD